jgi:hypothetical protein
MVCIVSNMQKKSEFFFLPETEIMDGSRQQNKRKINEEDLITLPTGHKVLRDEFMRLTADTGKSGRPARVHIDKLPSISGSIAGTSSKFLEEFRRMQEKDRAREDKFAREAREEKDRMEFDHRREERQRYFLEEAAKKREKRQKRKLKKPSPTNLPIDVLQEIKAAEKDAQHPPSHSVEPVRVSHPYAIKKGDDLVETFPAVRSVHGTPSIAPVPPPPQRITIIEDD